MDFFDNLQKLKKSLMYFVIPFILSYPLQSAMALTISPQSTIGVTQSYDPESKSTIFTTTATNANLNHLTIAEALSTNDVVIRDNIDQDVILTAGTKLIWTNGNNLTINALRHIIVPNQAQINSQSNGDLVLRADARGETQGTFLYPTNGEPGVVMDGGGTVKVFYRPTSFSTPTDFTSTIKTTGFGLMKAFMMINSFADLQNMRLNLAGNYALARNIDAQGLTFAPVGNETTPFIGHFDGQGYVINRLSIYQTNNDNIGLFGYTLNATVEDVGLVNANVLGRNYVGGLVGYNKVNNPSFFEGSIRRTFIMGNISGVSQVGGLIGFDDGGTIAQSFSDGQVSASSGVTNGGGGGLIGFTNGAIVDSYSMSKVNPLSGNVEMGGLFGSTTDISCVNDYASGFITPSTYTGGVFSRYSSSGKGAFLSVFWDKDSTGRPYAVYNAVQIPGTVGLNTQDMQTKDTYVKAGWDFVNVWDMEEGKYPYLLWTKRTPPWTSIQNSVTKAYRIVG